MPHVLHVASGENVRELGGYPVGDRQTRYHRFLRSGFTSNLIPRDLRYLERYGVRMVLDLRSAAELRAHPDPFAHQLGVRYCNVSFYDFNLRDPSLELPAGDDETLVGFLTSSYLEMLATTDAVRMMFAFFATAQPTECVLFHCTAGMDRTGVVAMLLLGLAGVDRTHIIADYAYSYATTEEVDSWVFDGETPSPGVDSSLYKASMQVMAAVYDRLCAVYGDVPTYLRSCGVTDKQLAAVRDHLL